MQQTSWHVTAAYSSSCRRLLENILKRLSVLRKDPKIALSAILHCKLILISLYGLASCCSSTVNRYLLRAMSKVGAGASEFFDSKAKSKWERKVHKLCRRCTFEKTCFGSSLIVFNPVSVALCDSWEVYCFPFQVKWQLSKAEQPGLTSVAVTWQQHDSGTSSPVQAPHQLLSLFNGSRQVVYGFADNCTQVVNGLFNF